LKKELSQKIATTLFLAQKPSHLRYHGLRLLGMKPVPCIGNRDPGTIWEMSLHIRKVILLNVGGIGSSQK
jgi:hypothetical protein